jgi:hypothetical protein
MGERALRPFWIHQLAEYLIGVALVAQGLQSPEPLVPAILGVVVIVNIAVARGPLSAFSWVGRRTHRWLDLVIMVAIAAAVLQPWIESDSGARVVMAILLGPLGFLWFYTDWAEKKGRKDRRAAQAGQSSAQVGRVAGRVAGNAYNAVKARSKPK